RCQPAGPDVVPRFHPAGRLDHPAGLLPDAVQAGGSALRPRARLTAPLRRCRGSGRSARPVMVLIDAIRSRPIVILEPWTPTGSSTDAPATGSGWDGCSPSTKDSSPSICWGARGQTLWTG